MLDNDQAMRGLLQLALERNGFQVHPAATAADAERVLAAASTIDAMLLDLHLGGGHSGVSLVRDWREAGALAPFLVVTGTPEDPSLAELDHEPMFRGVLAKPFLLDELVARVQQITS